MQMHYILSDLKNIVMKVWRWSLQTEIGSYIYTKISGCARRIHDVLLRMSYKHNRVSSTQLILYISLRCNSGLTVNPSPPSRIRSTVHSQISVLTFYVPCQLRQCVQFGIRLCFSGRIFKTRKTSAMHAAIAKTLLGNVSKCTNSLLLVMMLVIMLLRKVLRSGT